MGYSFFNTAVMKMEMNNFQSNVETAIHEFLHAFGFSRFMYNHFLDEKGIPRGKDVLKKVMKRGKETHILDLPRLTKLARDYFGCDSIEGVEMENQGGSGSLGSHFEHRMVREDLMVSHADKNLQFTEFLAVLLEETHWYRINRKYVGRSLIGYKAGCSYINEKCVTSYDSSSRIAKVVNQMDFCSNIGVQNICNSRYTHGSYCGTTSFSTWTGIDPAFDYFNGLMMTKGTSNSDNCPLKSPWSNQDCRDSSRSAR